MGRARGYAGRVHIDVLYFGVLKDLTLCDRERLELPESAQVSDLLTVLRERASKIQGAPKTQSAVPIQCASPSEGSPTGPESPKVSESPKKDGQREVHTVWSSLAVAVNREYAGLATVLTEGDEVALLPPVSGGLEMYAG